ncbi:MAG TPA: TonB-dependent receptor, partial [Rhizomicrobium sp.]|nr:TonB-dependent receptor [Rhizomicrobium sp.]
MATSIAVLCGSAPVSAQVRQFDVPSEDAGKSIPEFARQAHIQVVAPGDLLHGVITPPIKGAYDVFAALDLMLKGRGLTVTHLAEGVVTISPLETKKREEREEMSPKLKSSTSFLALLFGLVAQSATAQTPANSADSGTAIEGVTVSASRISIQGYEAPTPVTVIGAAQLDREAKIDIGDAIRELPAVGGLSANSPGPNIGHAVQGDTGIDTINLRNLGDIRTLTLFDGQRVVSSNPVGGGVDLSTIPTALIERVDIVTGGASAAWGSDAVAGVVNLIVN